MSKKKKDTQTLGARTSKTQKTATARAAAVAIPITQDNQEISMMNTKEKSEKMTTDAATMSKEQMDAFMQSGNMFMKGAENFMKTYTSLIQDSVEKNSEAVKSLMSCKTLNELTETQTRLAQDSFDNFISNATKLSEMSVKLATEAFEPINSQMGKSMKKTMDSMAA